MCKSIGLLVVFVVCTCVSEAAAVNVDIGVAGRRVALAWAGQATAQTCTSAEARTFVGLTARDVKRATGRKLRLGERVAFAIAKRQLRRQLRQAPTAEHYAVAGNDEGFGLGIALGVLLGILGVVIAYVLHDDKPRVVKGAWIGFGINAVLSVVLFVVILNALVNATTV